MRRGPARRSRSGSRRLGDQGSSPIEQHLDLVGVLDPGHGLLTRFIGFPVLVDSIHHGHVGGAHRELALTAQLLVGVGSFSTTADQRQG